MVATLLVFNTRLSLTGRRFIWLLHLWERVRMRPLMLLLLGFREFPALSLAWPPLNQWRRLRKRPSRVRILLLHARIRGDGAIPQLVALRLFVPTSRARGRVTLLKFLPRKLFRVRPRTPHRRRRLVIFLPRRGLIRRHLNPSAIVIKQIIKR